MIVVARLNPKSLALYIILAARESFVFMELFLSSIQCNLFLIVINNEFTIFLKPLLKPTLWLNIWYRGLWNSPSEPLPQV